MVNKLPFFVILHVEAIWNSSSPSTASSRYFSHIFAIFTTNFWIVGGRCERAKKP